MAGYKTQAAVAGTQLPPPRLGDVLATVRGHQRERSKSERTGEPSRKDGFSWETPEETKSDIGNAVECVGAPRRPDSAREGAGRRQLPRERAQP